MHEMERSLRKTIECLLGNKNCKAQNEAVLDKLVEILKKRLGNIAVAIATSAKLASRKRPCFKDVERAFQTLGITVRDLRHEYRKERNVKIVKGAVKVSPPNQQPQLPLSQINNTRGVAVGAHQQNITPKRSSGVYLSQLTKQQHLTPRHLAKKRRSTVVDEQYDHNQNIPTSIGSGGAVFESQLTQQQQLKPRHSAKKRRSAVGCQQNNANQSRPTSSGSGGAVIESLLTNQQQLQPSQLAQSRAIADEQDLSYKNNATSMVLPVVKFSELTPELKLELSQLAKASGITLRTLQYLYNKTNVTLMRSGRVNVNLIQEPDGLGVNVKQEQEGFVVEPEEIKVNVKTEKIKLGVKTKQDPQVFGVNIKNESGMKIKKDPVNVEVNVEEKVCIESEDDEDDEGDIVWLID